MPTSRGLWDTFLHSFCWGRAPQSFPVGPCPYTKGEKSGFPIRAVRKNTDPYGRPSPPFRDRDYHQGNETGKAGKQVGGWEGKAGTTAHRWNTQKWFAGGLQFWHAIHALISGSRRNVHSLQIAPSMFPSAV